MWLGLGIFGWQGRMRSRAGQLLEGLAQLLLIQLHASNAGAQLPPALFFFAGLRPSPQRHHCQRHEDDEECELAARAHGCGN